MTDLTLRKSLKSNNFVSLTDPDDEEDDPDDYFDVDDSSTWLKKDKTMRCFATQR